MAVERILSHEGFELDWESSGDFLHLVCGHPNLKKPLGFCLDPQERKDFLEVIRSAQRAQLQPLDCRRRLGSLPARPARLRVSIDPGPHLVLEAIEAGLQLFEVSLGGRSALRALIHLLTQEEAGLTRRVDGILGGREEGRVQLGSDWGDWKEPLSHVLGPSGEWLPLGELPQGLCLRGWLNDQGAWERLSFAVDAPVGPDRLVERGLYEQAEAAYSVMQDNPAKQELGRAYLAVMRGPLLEALPHLAAAREQSSSLSEADENLLLELESYLLFQQGAEKMSQISQNMQKLVARQITQDPWAARRALSNWRVLLDLIFSGNPPGVPLQVWQGWLAQLPTPIQVPTLCFARPGSWSPPEQLPTAPVRQLPPERSQLAPLLAIVLALILGFWWRWKHPVQWSPATSTPEVQQPNEPPSTPRPRSF